MVRGNENLFFGRSGFLVLWRSGRTAETSGGSRRKENKTFPEEIFYNPKNRPRDKGFNLQYRRDRQKHDCLEDQDFLFSGDREGQQRPAEDQEEKD